MSSNALRLLDEALQLPEHDRAELALRLLDSVGEVERAWIDEAKRRLGEIERGEVSTVPWPEARARIFARPPFFTGIPFRSRIPLTHELHEGTQATLVAHGAVR